MIVVIFLHMIQQRAPRSAPSRSRGQRQFTARKSASRVPNAVGPPSLTVAHVKGFVMGVIAGALVGASSMVYLTKEPSLWSGGPVVTAPSIAGGDVANNSDNVKEAPKPRFDFYTLLPNQSLDLRADIDPAAISTKRTSVNHYVLQVGSFRMQKDADQRRAELALIGLESQIDRTESENGVWFRVYIGPFENRSVMEKVRSFTAQQSIDTLLLKRPHAQ